MSCICFHHSVLQQMQFHKEKMGDYQFLHRVHTSDHFHLKFVRSDLPIGVWANYDGEKKGGDGFVMIPGGSTQRQ